MAKTLGSVAVGTLVKINESGSPVNYLVVHQGLPSSMYDTSCDGTWLLRQKIYKNAAWDNGNSNALPGADIFTTMEEMLPLYDKFIQDAIKTVKIPYCIGGGSPTVRSGANGLQCKIFPLSVYEIGLTTNYNSSYPVDGAKLEYFISGNEIASKDKRVAYYENNTANWWIRSQYTGNSNDVWSVLNSGLVSIYNAATKYGIRPCLVLPQNLYVEKGNVVIGPSPGSITVPSIAIQTQPITVSWSSVSGADSYILQRNADNGGWTQVYAGPLTTFTDTAGSWTTVQYQVCGVFGGVNGAFAVSPTIQVLPASALSIAGTDGDLGALTSDVPYSVATNTGKNVTMDIAVNGVNMFHRADATTYTGTLSVLDLPTGMGSIVLSASVQADSGMVTTERKWTYTKPAQPFPASGGVAALTKDGKPLFPQTLAECVRTIGGPWGGDLGKALEKLARAATYSKTTIPKYIEVKVDLSKVQAGDIVNLPVNGVMVPHIVVQVGNPDPEMYDSSCDGVWLLRQEIVELGEWNITNINTLAGSTIMTTMQGYVTDYDSAVQAAIQTVKIPYCVGGGGMTIKTLSNGLSCKMFPLNAYEIGTKEVSTIPLTGKKLDYFLSGNNAEGFAKRIFNYNGSPKDWLTRDPQPETSDRYIQIDYRGYAQVSLPMSMEPAKGYLPCFLLPTTFAATYYVDESGTVYPSQEYTTAGDFYDLWGNVIPTVKIATGSYTGTGTYGADNPNTIAIPKSTFAVIIQVKDGSDGNWVFALYGTKLVYLAGQQQTIRIIWSSDQMNWWNTTSGIYQLNGNGSVYHYIVAYL